MGIKSYGVWVATPTSYKAQFDKDDKKSPHLTLFFDDGSDKSNLSTAINVKSTSTETRLVYWFDQDFKHPITDQLRELDSGFHWIPDRDKHNAKLALDFQRQDPPLLKFEDGLVLPHDIPGPDNDVLDNLIPIVTRAIDNGSGKNTVFIFGSSYKTGIHDVHMNQGSLPKYDNGVWQDGALLFHFPEDDHFEAVFLAFASQRVPTDDNTGLALDSSKSLAEIGRSVVPN